LAHLRVDAADLGRGTTQTLIWYGDDLQNRHGPSYPMAPLG
jgi:hypothetical protein